MPAAGQRCSCGRRSAGRSCRRSIRSISIVRSATSRSSHAGLHRRGARRRLDLGREGAFLRRVALPGAMQGCEAAARAGLQPLRQGGVRQVEPLAPHRGLASRARDLRPLSRRAGLTRANHRDRADAGARHLAALADAG